MAVLSTTHPTLLDFQKSLDPMNKVSPLIEMLSQTNEMLADAVWIEGNLPTGHQTTVRTGLPTPTWRKLYGGVQPTKSTRDKVTETCGMLEAYAEVDKALADLNGNTAAWRLSEDAAHIEGISQELQRALIYESEATNPERITGFDTRFNSVSALNGENILGRTEGTGTLDNTSIWLVVWGPNTVHCIYPKGSTAGLQVHDKGQVTIENIDGAGGRMEAYRTHYRWDCGLAVRDWRYVVRVQYDVGDVVANGATGPVLADLMSQALRRIPAGGLSMGRPAFYMNRDSMDKMDLQAMHNPTMAFKTIEDAQGKFVTTFRAVPIRRVDRILSTEAIIA